MKSEKPIRSFFKSFSGLACIALFAVGFTASEAQADLSINPYPLANSASQSQVAQPDPQSVQPSAPSMVMKSSGAPLNITAPQSGTSAGFSSFTPSRKPAPAFQVLDIPSVEEWRAFKGANVQEVVDHWSQGAGIELIWNTYSDYEVQDTVAVQGGYDAAIESLLSQFNGEYIRPVGSLHIDPVSGQKTLVVVTYEGS